MKDAMMEALKKRRGKGMEISIMLGAPVGQQEEEKQDDMAPAPEEQEAQKLEIEMEPAEGEEELALEEEGEMPSEEMTPESLDAELMAKMSDYDKDQLGKGKPKSLFERAKLAALKRAK